jgi:hypothetical protein
MKETLTPEQQETAAKISMISHLDSVCALAETCVSDIRYFKESDMVRIRHKDGHSVCISAEGKNALALLYETVYELKPFLVNSINKIGWNKSFGPGASFSFTRLSK